MGKKGVRAMRRLSGLLFLILVAAMILCSGCETVKGTVDGASRDIKNITSSSSGWLSKTDKWMRENLW